jgi:hypothetical protein
MELILTPIGPNRHCHPQLVLSRLICISKRAGKIVYDGSACEEE